MQAKLEVVGGKANKSEVSLKLPTMIGRSPSAGLTIAHPMVSRQHCEVFEADGMLMVRDLGSLNGTLVGGERIKESPLPPGAEFRVGPLTFRAKYDYAGELGQVPDVDATSADGAEAESMDLQVVDEPAGGDVTLSEDEVVEFLEVPGEKPASGTAESAAVKAALPAKQPGPKEKPAAKSAAKPTGNAMGGKLERAAGAKDAKARPKAGGAEDPTELPDDLFDDLLKGLD
jgi:hypothetical protein